MQTRASHPGAAPHPSVVRLRYSAHARCCRSSRLHTSVLVRRVDVEHNVSWPTGIRLRRSSAGATPATPANASHAPAAAAPAASPAPPQLPALGLARLPADRPPAPPLVSARSTSGGGGGDSALSPDDPLLTWAWDVFAHPITALSNVAGDFTMAPEEAGPGGAAAAAGPGSARGLLGSPPPLLADRVAAGEVRLADAVMSIFRQFALLR